MLLRASGEHDEVEHDFDAIVAARGNAESVPDAGLLSDFADAAIDGNAARLWATRERVLEALGSAALTDTAATVAIFNAVVKVADATGIPIEDYKIEPTRDLRAELGIDEFGQAHS